MQSGFEEKQYNMVRTLVVFCLLGMNAVKCFRVTSRIEPFVEPEPIVSSPKFRSYERPLDPPYPDHSTYEAIFAGVKRPISVDCTQQGIICKFPLLVADKERQSPKPAKHVKEVSIIKGVEASGDSETEGREELEAKVETTVLKTTDKGKVPVYTGSLDVESIAADDKEIEDTWILEKNIHNKKFQIPVKLIPSKHHHEYGTAPVYPVPHDFHDHFSNGDLYHFPNDRHGSGWTNPSWSRAHPSVYHYHSSQPCQQPVYHYPPPCNPAVAPTTKPIINIDDKIDKEED